MKKLFWILPVVALAFFIFAGCTKDDGYAACTDEQKAAEMCTMEYMPVCGDDGMTYGNACAACASQNIDGYREGECEINE